MDITSPITLWKEYDVKTLPLNETGLSQKYEDGITVKEYYFDGYTTVDGRVRAYVKILENADAKGVVLLLPDAEYSIANDVSKTLYDLGYSVVVLDYLGKTEKRMRYTLYPNSLANCNCDGITEFEIKGEDKYSRWYIWTCIARRATYLISNLYDKPIYAVGIGLGGSTVYKLSAFDDGLTACATLLNIIPNVTGEGNAIINFRASLDNYAYSSISKVPMFMAVATNDADGSLDDMSELAESTASLKFLRIVERGFAPGITTVIPTLDSFFSDNEKSCPHPEVTASNSDGNLYLKITTSNTEESTETEVVEKAAKLDLYLSFCVKEVPFRNWMNIPAISLGDGRYIAQINVCDAEKPLYAFVNATDENGIIRSSTIVTVIPKNLGIKSKSGVPHRKIYDGSMGTDCWTSRKGGKIELVNGPYGIEGVTSEKNSMLTFKPGDPLFKVPIDTLLQIMASGKPQKLTVKVSDTQNTYFAEVSITNSDDWHKFSLSHSNFKSSFGPLADWSQILTLEFSSDEPFIIGSVLWI